MQFSNTKIMQFTMTHKNILKRGEVSIKRKMEGHARHKKNNMKILGILSAKVYMEIM